MYACLIYPMISCWSTYVFLCFCYRKQQKVSKFGLGKMATLMMLSTSSSSLLRRLPPHPPPVLFRKGRQEIVCFKSSWKKALTDSSSSTHHAASRRDSTSSSSSTDDDDDDNKQRKILQSVLWAAEGVYIIWLFLLPYAPVCFFNLFSFLFYDM